MAILHTPNPVHYNPNLALAHPQSCPIPPIHLIPPIWSNWGCNHGTQFCTIPPIWSIGGIRQDWGGVYAPNFVTGHNWGFVYTPPILHMPPDFVIGQNWGCLHPRDYVHTSNVCRCCNYTDALFVDAAKLSIC